MPPLVRDGVNASRLAGRFGVPVGCDKSGRLHPFKRAVQSGRVKSVAGDHTAFFQIADHLKPVAAAALQNDQYGRLKKFIEIGAPTGTLFQTRIHKMTPLFRIFVPLKS